MSPSPDRALLRSRGFRPLRQRGDQALLLNAAANNGYQWQVERGEIWLRRRSRTEDTARSGVLRGPRLSRTDSRRADLEAFLASYRSTAFAHYQARLHQDFDGLRRLVASAEREVKPYRRLNFLTRALTFCPPDLLVDVLYRLVLPAFFEFDPEGVVRPLLLDDNLESQFGFLRACYAYDHYPMHEIRAANAGFAALTAWDRGVSVDYLSTVLGILQSGTYPYYGAFDGGPFGLTFVFLLSSPSKHEPDYFPRSWLHLTRTDAMFGSEHYDHLAALADPYSSAYEVASHQRYMFRAPLSCDLFEQTLDWSLDRLSHLISEVTDPANFIDSDGYMDLTFAFEHSLTLLRVLRRTLHALTTEELPAGKLLAFDVADLLDALSCGFGQTRDTELFKTLFNPAEGRDLLRRIILSLPSSLQGHFVGLLDLLYDDLENTVIQSVWLPGKVSVAGIRVKNRTGTAEVTESRGEFVGNIMRALRNTHHGFLTRLDKSRRPSRYSALITGDTPSSMSLLPLLWAIALLANPNTVTGWQTLPQTGLRSSPSRPCMRCPGSDSGRRRF